MGATHSKFLLPLLFTGVLMGALDIAIIGPALPAIQAEFDMNSRQLAVLFNAYVLCQMLGTQLLAKMADRVGTRNVYVAGISMFALGSLMLVIAGDMYTLYAGRAIQGLGAGGIFPVASTVIAGRMPPEKRGAALGLLGTVWGIAFLIGPILGGLLLKFSWHWLFLVNLPIAAVLIAGAIWLLPREPARKHRPFDFAGAATLSTAVIALVLGINNLDTADVFNSMLSLGVTPFLLLVAVMLPLFWHFEKRAADPVIRPGMLATRQVTTACIIAAGVGAMQTAGVFYPAMAVASMDVSLSDAAFLLVPGVVLSTIAAPIVGRLINGVGTRLIVLVALGAVGCQLHDLRCGRADGSDLYRCEPDRRRRQRRSRRRAAPLDHPERITPGGKGGGTGPAEQCHVRRPADRRRDRRRSGNRQRRWCRRLPVRVPGHGDPLRHPVRAGPDPEITGRRAGPGRGRSGTGSRLTPARQTSRYVYQVPPSSLRVCSRTADG